MPYKTSLTFTYDCGEFKSVLNDCLDKADYSGFEARRKQSAKQNKLRGVGISCSIEQAAAPQTETAELRFDPSGTVTVLIGTTNHGQGHETIYKQLVCEKLGLEPEKIRVIEGDSDKISFGTGTGGSRSATLGTSAIFEAVVKIEKKCRSIAAHILEASESDIEFEEGIFQVTGTNRSLTFIEAVQAAFKPSRLPSGLERGPYEIATYNPEKPNFPNGCHVCEIEIDPTTGVVEIVRYTVVHDVGYEINPLLIKGQVRGGIVQGAGQALMEDLKYDLETGQLLSGSFMDYAMPRASDFCDIVNESHPVPTQTNPLGVKGAGECGTVGALPAVMNAINNALALLGVHSIEMPATQEKIWQSIQLSKGTNP